MCGIQLCLEEEGGCWLVVEVSVRGQSVATTQELRIPATAGCTTEHDTSNLTSGYIVSGITIRNHSVTIYYG